MFIHIANIAFFYLILNKLLLLLQRPVILTTDGEVPLTTLQVGISFR